MNQELLNKWLSEVIKQAENINIKLGKINPIVDISRAKSWFGQCRRRNGMYEIRISKFHEGGENAIKETMAHEILHTCKGCMNHKKEWKRFADVMNKAYNYHIQRVGGQFINENDVLENKTISKSNVISNKYILKCKECGNTWSREKESKFVKYPGLYRCRCGGRIERIK